MDHAAVSGGPGAALLQRGRDRRAVNQRAETVRGQLMAPQVGLEPTTLRLTVAAGTIATGCCRCLLITENRTFDAHIDAG
jgi:hypothetical protein